jgi:hypothetical protein
MNPVVALDVRREHRYDADDVEQQHLFKEEQRCETSGSARSARS